MPGGGGPHRLGKANTKVCSRAPPLGTDGRSLPRGPLSLRGRCMAGTSCIPLPCFGGIPKEVQTQRTEPSPFHFLFPCHGGDTHHGRAQAVS